MDRQHRRKRSGLILYVTLTPPKTWALRLEDRPCRVDTECDGRCVGISARGPRHGVLQWSVGAQNRRRQSRLGGSDARGMDQALVFLAVLPAVVRALCAGCLLYTSP